MFDSVGLMLALPVLAETTGVGSLVWALTVVVVPGIFVALGFD